jgi:uncharacterized RDD family membrane protein YckC
MILPDFAEDALVRGVLWRRVAAFCVDAILLGGVVALAWHLFLVFGILTLGLSWPLFGVLPLFPLAYTWLFASSPMGATPGMALFGLLLARNDTLGRPDGLAVLGWAIGYYVTMAVGVIWLAVAVLTTRKRTIHDLLSGLVVVRMNTLTDLGRSGIMGGGGQPSA